MMLSIKGGEAVIKELLFFLPSFLRLYESLFFPILHSLLVERNQHPIAMWVRIVLALHARSRRYRHLQLAFFVRKKWMFKGEGICPRCAYWEDAIHEWERKKGTCFPFSSPWESNKTAVDKWRKLACDFTLSTDIVLICVWMMRPFSAGTVQVVECVSRCHLHGNRSPFCHSFSYPRMT